MSTSGSGTGWNWTKIVLVIVGVAAVIALLFLGFKGFQAFRAGRAPVAEAKATPTLPTPPAEGEWVEEKVVSAETPEPQTLVASGNLGTGVQTCSKTTGEAKQNLALDVQRLGNESCAWVWRGTQVTARCPSGWICTITEPGGAVNVYDGKNDLTMTLTAGTFRYKSGYPAADAVHDRCALLVKEQAFGSGEDPSFGVSAGNFTCDEIVQPVVSACPDSPESAAKLIGGASANWRLLPETDSSGWKYEGPAKELTAPSFGRIDHPTGSARNGQKVTTSVATFWCRG